MARPFYRVLCSLLRPDAAPSTGFLAAVMVWAINAFPYGDAGLKKIATIIVVVLACFWLIGLFFHVGPGTLSTVRVG